MKVVKMLLCFLLLASCGSIKKSVKEDTDQTLNVVSSTVGQGQATQDTSSESSIKTVTSTTEQSSDDTETITIIETTWYDTSKVDSNGVSPVLKTENLTNITHNKKKSEKDSEGQSDSEEKKKSSTTVQTSVNKEESAESAYKNTTQKDSHVTETKQLQYLSWVLIGLAVLVLSAILAYWVFTKYRR